MSPVTDLLRVDHLAMRFGGLRAIDDVSFTAPAHGITAIIGPNGAGKTTLFNCLTGFYRPTAGRILLTHPAGATHALHRLAGHRVAARARVARTFQNIRLFAGMTALENLLVAQHNALRRRGGTGLSGLLNLPAWRRAEQAAIATALAWLQEVSLADRADTPAGALPYGAQRRLEIARAMCTNPVLLCLDEPAAGLNPRESDALSDLLLRLRANGTTLLLIEHDMRVVMRIADHVVVLDHGRKIAEGPPDLVRCDPAVIAAYLGEEVPA
jgi:branched-chain amino acid transport system ATP-binding protein